MKEHWGCQKLFSSWVSKILSNLDIFTISLLYSELKIMNLNNNNDLFWDFIYILIFLLFKNEITNGISKLEWCSININISKDHSKTTTHYFFENCVWGKSKNQLT